MTPHLVTISFLAQLGVISLTLAVCSLLKDQVRGEGSKFRDAWSGLIFGVTAGILMNMPGELLQGFRFDLRIVPVAIAGLVAGPVGSGVAATVASVARLQLGGAGAFVGLGGIWLGFCLGCIGWLMLRKGWDRTRHMVLFSALNAGVALVVLLVLPKVLRDSLTQNNQHLVLIGLNFLASVISAFYIRLDQQRRDSAQLNALHRQVVAALPDALNVKDLQGRFLIANDATVALLGAGRAEELIGRTDQDYLDPADAARFREQDVEFTSNPEPMVVEQRFTRDERDVWLSTVKAPYFDETGNLRGVVSHSTDVTEQRALQAELAATQALLQTAMNEMADGLAMFDRDGRLTIWNRRYTSLFPYVDAESCRGRTLAEILTAGVLRGEIAIPPDAIPLSWVEEEVQRSASAEASELLLSSGRWVSKTTSALADGGWVTLYADITEKKAAIEQLEGLANKDGLTGIANRRCFNERLGAAVEIAKRSHEPLSLLMVDVDHFKAYNDTYGHPAGDEVLRALAAALQASCRDGDDLVARYGGEEFAMIMPGATETMARVTADRIAQTVRELDISHASSDKGRITVSIGISTLSRSMLGDPSVLLETGDRALYAAKCAGRDTIRAAEFVRELPVSA
jgi:diguanylate cyclase (GGDEF)-like protein/PAS domain S-box-containing protein